MRTHMLQHGKQSASLARQWGSHRAIDTPANSHPLLVCVTFAVECLSNRWMSSSFRPSGQSLTALASPESPQQSRRGVAWALGVGRWALALRMAMSFDRL